MTGRNIHLKVQPFTILTDGDQLFVRLKVTVNRRRQSVVKTPQANSYETHKL